MHNKRLASFSLHIRSSWFGVKPLMMRLNAAGNRDEPFNTEGVNITWVAGWEGLSSSRQLHLAPSQRLKDIHFSPTLRRLLSFLLSNSWNSKWLSLLVILLHGTRCTTWSPTTLPLVAVACWHAQTGSPGRDRRVQARHPFLVSIEFVFFLFWGRWVVEGFHVFCLRIF